MIKNNIKEIQIIKTSYHVPKRNKDRQNPKKTFDLEILQLFRYI